MQEVYYFIRYLEFEDDIQYFLGFTINYDSSKSSTEQEIIFHPHALNGSDSDRLLNEKEIKDIVSAQIKNMRS